MATGRLPTPGPSPSELPPPRRAKTSNSEAFVSFKLRDFRYLSISTLASGFAQWANQLAIFALVYEMTGSAVQLGAVAAFRGGVGTLVAPFGGYLSDRFPRRRIIVTATLLDAGLAGFLAVLVLLDVAHVWHVYVIAFVGGLLQSINQPARQAFVYDVTTDETLQNAIAVNSMVQNVARVLGPSAFGVMMAAWGIASGLIVLVALQVIASLATMRIGHITRQARVTETISPLRMIGQGFRYAWQDKRILGLITLSAIPSLLIYPYVPFLKIVSEDVLHRGNSGFGILSSMLGWGSLVGLVALIYLGSARIRGRLMVGGFLVYAIFLFGFSQSSNYALSLSILATAGIFHSVAMALNNTLLQEVTRNDMRGRVMAVNQMSFGLQAIGSFPLAFAISAWGVQAGIGLFMALASVAFVIFLATWGSVRRLQ